MWVLVKLFKPIILYNSSFKFHSNCFFCKNCLVLNFVLFLAIIFIKRYKFIISFRQENKCACEVFNDFEWTHVIRQIFDYAKVFSVSSQLSPSRTIRFKMLPIQTQIQNILNFVLCLAPVGKKTSHAHKSNSLFEDLFTSAMLEPYSIQKSTMPVKITCKCVCAFHFQSAMNSLIQKVSFITTSDYALKR